VLLRDGLFQHREVFLLAGDRPALRDEQVADAIAQRGVAAVADMQRPGRVG
jgi:hypothetical protein